jgi:hypothetical protein
MQDSHRRRPSQPNRPPQGIVATCPTATAIPTSQQGDQRKGPFGHARTRADYQSHCHEQKITTTIDATAVDRQAGYTFTRSPDIPPSGAFGDTLTRRLIRRKRIYNFLCSMLILHQLLCVLITLRGIFMHFFGTNLLTRYHSASASSCFLLFLCFRKVTQEIFSELDETKPKVPIFLTRDGVQSRDGGGPGGRHTIGWRRPPHGRATRWCGPMVHPLTSPFRIYNPSDVKTLNQSASLHKKFCSAATIEDKVWGIEVSVPAPCRDGELPPEPSLSTPLPSPSSLLSPMMRRE